MVNRKGKVYLVKTDTNVCTVGQLGVVFDDYDTGIQVIFEHGDYCGFANDEITTFLIVLPLFSYEVSNYSFDNVIRLSNDYANNVFKFDLLKDAYKLIGDQYYD